MTHTYSKGHKTRPLGEFLTPKTIVTIEKEFVYSTRLGKVEPKYFYVYIFSAQGLISPNDKSFLLLVCCVPFSRKQ